MGFKMIKSYIWLRTEDGSIQQVEKSIAISSPMICEEIVVNGKGSSKNCAVSLPECVTTEILGLILNYCQFHQVTGRSDKERKNFDDTFVRTDTSTLCLLATAAEKLQLNHLLQLICKALAREFQGNSPDKIREKFHIQDDLTEEEKLKPLKNMTHHPHIRLLNKLNARKLKELNDKNKFKDVEVAEDLKDERSIDDILSFINGTGEGVELFCFTHENENLDNALEASSSKHSVGPDLPNIDLSPNVEFMESDFADDLDPVLQAEIDRLDT
ncbi:SKP1-like protein 21 [Cicer arietinum]|uniref:SKP1-like protein 21 n=1 Tax=Cicer arietinum TaxID=3827 RepID=A0A1S3EL62_CICAR|nr:SKP1-like protein 21 [Cicer arietinum]